MKMAPYARAMRLIQNFLGPDENLGKSLHFQSGVPFARANFHRELLEIAMRMPDARLAVASVPEYVSRGKRHRTGHVAVAVSNSVRARLTIQKPPINGRRDCERRVQQEARRNG